MRIGVLSDTHGNIKSIEKAVDKLKDSDIILHAGDLYQDVEYIKAIFGKEVIGVLGNCDSYYTSEGEFEKVLKLQNKSIFLTHGHYFHIKEDLGMLIKKAKELKVDAVVFGHTHKTLNIKIDNIVFLNPGSPALPRGGFSPSCGILEIIGEEITSKIIEI